MHCRVPGCQLARKWDPREGYLRGSCCRECYWGRHSSECTQFEREVDPPEHAPWNTARPCSKAMPGGRVGFGGRQPITRSRSPLSRTTGASSVRMESLRVLVHPPLQPRVVNLVSLGMHGLRGSRVLAANPGLKEYMIDVRRWLQHDPRRGPTGLDPVTQLRVRQTRGFESLFPLVLGAILCQPLVLLGCTAGHHRSVACVELAQRHIESLALRGITLNVVHLELGDEDFGEFLIRWNSNERAPGRWRGPR